MESAARLIVLLAAAVLPAVFALPTRAAPRYVARLADGSWIEGEQLSDGHESQGQLKLDGRPLGAPGKPLAWLRDRSLRPDERGGPAVEMIGGDRLPGIVVGFRSGGQSMFDPSPPHLLVAPDVNVNAPAAKDGLKHVRVLTRFVRRVVWQPLPAGSARVEPGSARFRDGRVLRFRQVQFGEDFVRLLRDDGIVAAKFHDLAEIHLADDRPWQAYFDELVVLSPNSDARLIQFETTTGLIVTASQSRFAAAAHGDVSKSADWWYGVAPAWALDPLWLANRRVWIRRSFAPSRVPLSRIAPGGDASGGAVRAYRATWRANRSAYGRPLAGGGKDFGWGWGVHAPFDLRVPVPEMARAVWTGVGLDWRVGDGGCARARTFLGEPSGRPLYESPVLVGSQTLADTGRLGLPALRGPSVLILQADDLHQGRPRGADPFNVRDFVDWVDPVVELDARLLADEVRRRVSRHIPAWQGWTARLDPPGKYAFSDPLAPASAVRDGTSTPVRVTGAPLILSRRLTVDADHRWLLLLAHRRFEGSVPTDLPEDIEIRVDGTSLTKMVVPAWKDPLPSPLAFDLSAYHGREIELQLVQLPVDATLPAVGWRAALVVDRVSMLSCMFDEQGTFANAEDGASVSAEPSADAYTGERVVKIPAGGRYTLSLPAPVSVRADPHFNELRFLRFAVRKAGGGHICLEIEHQKDDGRDFAVRYDAGWQPPPEPTDERLWVDDAVPPDATKAESGAGESWRWISADEGPVHAGKKSTLRDHDGFGQQYFLGAKQPLWINSGDKLFAHVYLDPEKPPRELMLEWNDGNWEHRAYWGQNVVNHGINDTHSRAYLGPLPEPGKWARLEVDAARVGLFPGAPVRGMALTQYYGRVWWDAMGVVTAGLPEYGPARRAWQDRLPDRWVVVTCDLASDFGEMEVTGLTLHVPDGEHALVDHVYLGRTVQDFELIADAPRTIDVNYHARRELLRDAYEAGPPANVIVEVAGRRSAGVLIGDEGYVLTAGHLLIGDVKDATVMLGDGTKVTAKTAGICRDLDCSLVRLEKPPEIRGVELADGKEFDFRGERLSLVTGYYESDEGPLRRRSAHLRIHGELDRVLLTHGSMPGPWNSGLYGSSGRLQGIFMRPTLHYGRPYLHGGQIFSKAAFIAEQLPRLKRGEVWGSWFPGNGPMIGVYVTSGGEGAPVTGVMPDTPAAAVGIQLKDLIVEVNGKPVKSLYDMYDALANVDPGHEVTIKVRRDKQELTHKIRVVHRFDY